MRSTYKINFKQLRQENLKDAFAAFERAFTSLGIDFYLIGALARDTWFAQKGIRALGTKDMDWAVAITEEKQFKELKDFLVQNEGFTESSSNEYVLFDEKGLQIDLLPFGAIEIEGNKFIDSTGVVRTNISGFKEVYDEAVEEVNFENKFTFKVSSLPGVVILKFIAFDDRPEMRTKDIQDIGIILNHYFDIETEAIYSKHTDLFEHEMDLHIIAARVLGREMQSILNSNSLLKERVLSILYNNIEMLTESPIGLLLVPVLDLSPSSVEEAVRSLAQIVTGIRDNIENKEEAAIPIKNDYLSELAFFRDIISGNFELTARSRRYPQQPHTIFSKDYTLIKLTGQSTFDFYVIFFLATGEMYKIYITPLPGTSEITGSLPIPLKQCQIKFELVMPENLSKEQYCKLSFELFK